MAFYHMKYPENQERNLDNLDHFAWFQDVRNTDKDCTVAIDDA